MYHKADTDILQCVQDCGRELDQLCSFLGLSPSAEEKERILTGAKFDNMKHNKMANYSTVQIMDHSVSPFMRKGTVGHKCIGKLKPLSLISWCYRAHSLLFYRESWWLEEPLHCGAEWRVWWRPQEKDEELHTEVSYRNVEAWPGCA